MVIPFKRKIQMKKKFTKLFGIDIKSYSYLSGVSVNDFARVLRVILLLWCAVM